MFLDCFNELFFNVSIFIMLLVLVIVVDIRCLVCKFIEEEFFLVLVFVFFELI